MSSDRIMKKIFRSVLLISSVSITLLTACGGSADIDIIDRPPDQPTSAVITLSTAVRGTIPSSTTINSYDVTVNLPAGVTARSTTNPPVTDVGVVTATGSAEGSFVVAVYTAPTSTQAGVVTIHIVNMVGFSAGEFSVVNCDIEEGTDPIPSDFLPPILDSATGFNSNTDSTVQGLEQELNLTSTVVIH
jgi:hypothetical protein